MSTDALWEHEEPVTELGIDVPAWIDQDITPADVAAIVQGGCASGAYMPAVTYSDALATMERYGDERGGVLDYIESALGYVPDPPKDSWAGMACHFVSSAVELWAGSVEGEIRDAIEAAEDETEDAPA